MTAWVPGDPVYPREPDGGECADPGCGTTWTPAKFRYCPECGGPAKNQPEESPE